LNYLNLLFKSKIKYKKKKFEVLELVPKSFGTGSEPVILLAVRTGSESLRIARSIERNTGIKKEITKNENKSEKIRKDQRK
jgi:hypothetical protein